MPEKEYEMPEVEPPTDAPSETSVIAIFDDLAGLARALEDLLRAGISSDAIAVVARDGASRPVDVDALAEALEPPVQDEVLGGVLGAYAGLLGGLALLAVPGIGPVVLAGGAVAIAAETLAGVAAGAGLGTLLAAIFDQDRVERHRRLFAEALEAGRLLLVVRGTEDECYLAERVARRHDARHVDFGEVVREAR